MLERTLHMLDLASSTATVDQSLIMRCIDSLSLIHNRGGMTRLFFAYRTVLVREGLYTDEEITKAALKDIDFMAHWADRYLVFPDLDFSNVDAQQTLQTEPGPARRFYRDILDYHP